MAYTKMTVADFKKRLDNGDYKDATGARRGAGKADLTDAEKDQCRRAIDKHFGTEAAPTAKKPVAKKPKAVSKKVAAKKAAPTNGKSEHKANGTAQPIAKKAAAKGGRRRRSTELSTNDNDNELLVGLHLAKERIGTINQAVDTMRRCKETYSELDTQKGMTVAANALTDIMQEVHDSLRGPLQMEVAADPVVLETLARTAPAAVGLPGYESPVHVPNGESVS